MAKVYFVNSTLEGCYNVRCLFPLQACGYDGDRTSFNLRQRTPEQKSKAALNAEIVVFHRPIERAKLVLAEILKKAGKKIVMDNDDTLKEDNGFKYNEMMDEERVKRGLEKMNIAIDAFAKQADLITCSTEFLKQEYLKLNKNVVVLPNYIDPFYFPEPLRNETDIVRIGITGSVAMTSDIEVLKPIIEKYQNDPRVRLVLLSLPATGQNEVYKQLYSEEYAFWSGVNVEWHPFSKVDAYYETLNDLKLDFVIIPRADTYFNRCKSNLKFLENSMLEIPTIAQSFSTKDSPYEYDPEDTKHLLLAETQDQWVDQIEWLIRDKDKRRALGAEAKAYVEAKYDINNPENSNKWVEAYSLIK
jgi:glycosyltransferase involved in cell wall biosynthesis